MRPTVAKPARRKAKKSYTLSPESVAFLEAIRKRRRSQSVSAVLEEILQATRRADAKAQFGRATAQYYDSLTDDEVAEQALWGDFAASQFAKEDA